MAFISKRKSILFVISIILIIALGFLGIRRYQERKIIGTWGEGETQFTIAKTVPGGGPPGSPESFFVDADANIYILDNHNYKIKKFSKNGRLLLIFGSREDKKVHFSSITDITLDNQGYIYALEEYFGRVVKFDPKGNFLISTRDYIDAEGKSHRIGNAYRIDIDKEDNIYLYKSTGMDDFIYKLSPEWKLLKKYKGVMVINDKGYCVTPFDAPKLGIIVDGVLQEIEIPPEDRPVDYLGLLGDAGDGNIYRSYSKYIVRINSRGQVLKKCPIPLMPGMVSDGATRNYRVIDGDIYFMGELNDRLTIIKYSKDLDGIPHQIFPPKG